jgi:hypothetical protein
MQLNAYNYFKKQSMQNGTNGGPPAAGQMLPPSQSTPKDQQPKTATNALIGQELEMKEDDV